MSLFDTLFPQQHRASERRRPEHQGRAEGRVRSASRHRLRRLRQGEALERRDLLAVTVAWDTPKTFFTDFSRNFNSEYASYTVKNIDSGLIDAWVKVNFPASSEVGIGAAYNNNKEDGLYRVGPLNNGDSNEAFLYYTAKTNTTVAQPYTIEVWNGKPNAPGSSPLTPIPIGFTYDSIVDTNAAEPNKVSTVTISPAAPVIGDIMTMTVQGKLGSGANRVLFAPATRSDWKPDVFELRNVTNKISGTLRTADQIFYDDLPGGGSDEKPFTSVYQFLVAGASNTPTPIDPTQWTQDGNQKWKHHKPDDTPFPPIPPVSYDFTVTKTDGKATYTAGDLITYTLTIQNNSNLPVNDVLIKDTLPLPLINVGATAWTVTSLVNATRDSLQPNGVGDTLSGTVDFGAKGVVTIQIQMPTLLTATGPLTNTVSAKVPEDGEFVASDTNLDVALSLTKDDGVTTYTPGGMTTYTIVLSNTGAEPLNGITLDDDFPAQIDQTSTWSADYTGGASSGTLGEGGVGSFIGKTVNLGGKGGTVTITINAKILSSAVGAMTNTIEATLATGGDPIIAFDTNTPVRDERLSLTKDDGKTTYVPGTTTTYTIVLSNIGLSDVNGLIVSDSLPVQLDPLTTTWSAAYSNASGTLPETLTTGDILGTVNLKGSTGTVTITINGVILSTATDDMINTVNVRNGSTLSATDKNTCTPQVALSVDKTDGTDTYVPGTSTTYTITITNAGPSFLNDGTISDPLPPGVAIGGSWSVVSSTGAGTAVTPTGGTGSINANLDLAAGGQVVISYTVDTSPSATTPLINTVTVTPPQGQGVTATDTDTNTAKPTVVLTASKTDGKETYLPGDTLVYTIILTNNGPSTLVNGTVSDPLPVQIASASWTAVYSAGSSGPPSGTGAINATITLQPKGTATFTFTAIVSASAVGQLDNTVTVSPPPGTSGSPASDTDTNFPAEPPASINAALVVGSDDGCNGPPWVRVIDPISGVEFSRFLAYDARFRGSVRVATGDVTGDGVAEIITAPSRNLVGEVRVFQRNLLGAAQQNGLSEWTELTQYRTLAFGPRYRGGVEVAIANIDGIPGNEIVTAMSIQSGMVNVFKVTPGAIDPVANSPFRSFRGAPAGFNNGVMISAGDYIPGGFGEIAVGTNSGTRALVRIFDVSGTPKVVRSFNPFANGFRGGVTLSTADYDGNGSLDLIVGAGLNGGSRVEVWNPATPSSPIFQTSVFSRLAKPNARVFAVFGTAADGFLGPDSTFYGVQGLNGGRGSKGVWKMLPSGKADPLFFSQTILPPLRIAPIALPLAPIAPRLG